MNFEDLLNKKLYMMEKECGEISNQLKTMPKGLLTCTRNGPYIKWFFVNDDRDPSSRMYLSKSKRKVAQKIAMKTYLSCRKQYLEKQIICLKEYIEKNEQNVPLYVERETLGRAFSDLLENEPLKMDHRSNSLSPELEQWRDIPFQSAPPNPERRVIRSVRGIMVRSKAEDMIAHELDVNGIPFHYEETMMVDGHVMHPDFTILNPMSRSLMIWEHFGMMNRPSYAEAAVAKIARYHTAGYVPGVNLIITMESQTCTLSMSMISAVIQMYFGVS